MSSRFKPSPTFYGDLVYSPNSMAESIYVPRTKRYSPKTITYHQNRNGKSIWKTVKVFIAAYPSDILFQVVIAFAIGLIFAPWSWGLLYLLIFFILFEISYAFIHRDFSSDHVLVRITVVAASFFGWLVGRLSVEDRTPIRAKYQDKHCHLGCKDYELELDDDDEELYQINDLSKLVDLNHAMEFAQVDRSKMEQLIDQIILS